MNPTFDLVVPLWNEADNIEQLINGIAASGLLEDGLRRVILVDNGSLDATPSLIDRLALDRPWMQVEHLSENCGYGGGIHHGLCCSRAPYIAYMPGDNQVSCDDLATVWRQLRRARRHDACAGRLLFVKGWRRVRHDPRSMRLVSAVYTLLSNLLLHLRLRDVNALPKCFDRRLLHWLPRQPYRSFTIEPQLLTIALARGFRIIEVPVTFHARREGVSSWSGKRWRVYWTTFWQMYRLRGISRGQRPLLERFAARWEN